MYFHVVELNPKQDVPRGRMCSRLELGKGYYSTAKAVLDTFEVEALDL